MTGFNKAFVIDGPTRQRLIEEDPRSAEIIKPFAVGKDIRKWKVNRRDVWLIFTRRGIDIEQYPAIKRHLAQWQDELTPKKTGKEKAGRKPGPYQWYEIQDNVAYFGEFEKPKIVYPVIGRGPCFAYDSTGRYTNDKAFIIPTDDLYLLAILNSIPFWEIIRSACSPLRGGFWELRKATIENFPIRAAPDLERRMLTVLTQKCVDSHDGHSTDDFDQKIDEQIRALFRL